MNQLETSILINLAGNLPRMARRFQRSLSDLGRHGRASMHGLGRGVSAASRGLDRFGNRYTALASGATVAAAGRMLVNEQRRFTRLGIQADKSAESMDRLKREIYATARAPEIRVDADGILSAIEEIIEKTGDLEFAEKNLRNIGIALSATGGRGSSIGGILAEIQKSGITSPRQVLEVLDILNVQGKQGAFTLQNLAALGPRVVSAYASSGRSGVQMFREMGAALQVIRQGTGSSEMAATAFEALIRTLMDAKKVKLLEQGGIKIFDGDSLRPINQLMTDIVNRSRGNKTILSQIFDAEALRAFNSIAGEFLRDGKVQSLQKFMDVQADGATTMRDSARAARDAAGGLSALSTSARIFADQKLSGPFLQLTETLNSLEPETVDRWLKLIAGFGGLAVLNKIGRGGMKILRLLTPTTVGGAVFGQAAAVSLGATAGLGAVAIAGRETGKALTDWHVSMADRERLQQLRARHMVMGGGPDSYQVGAIDREVERRVFGEIKISFDDQGRPVVKQLTSSPNLDLDVDAGQMMRSH